jgi:hypothetical protein
MTPNEDPHPVLSHESSFEKSQPADDALQVLGIDLRGLSSTAMGRRVAWLALAAIILAHLVVLIAISCLRHP